MANPYAALLELGTAAIADVLGGVSWIDPRIRPVSGDTRMVGSALTVQTGSGDNLAIHRALELAEPGDVLVVDAHGDLAGYWGEMMTVAALERDVRGLVVDGGVRDVDEIARYGFPVFARGVCVRRTEKVNRGQVGAAIRIGGLEVERDYIIVGDTDGVVAFPPSVLSRVLADGHARREKEREVLVRLRNGATTIEAMSLDA